MSGKELASEEQQYSNGNAGYKLNTMTKDHNNAELTPSFKTTTRPDAKFFDPC